MSLNAALAAAAGQGHDWIAARVPHQGRMCLLDRVEHGVQCCRDGIAFDDAGLM